MAKLAIVFFAALAVHATFAAPKAVEKTQLEQLSAQVQDVAKNIADTLREHTPDSKDVTKALTDGSKQLASNIESIVKKLDTELETHKGETDNILKQFSGKLGEAIAHIQELSGPDASKQATQVKNQLQTTITNTAEEFEKLNKAVQPHLQHAGETVGTFVKGAFDDFLKATQDFQNQVETSIKKH